MVPYVLCISMLIRDAISEPDNQLKLYSHMYYSHVKKERSPFDE